MSKELETLDRILEAHNRLLDKYNLGGGLGNNYLIIKKALTSPTSEEVCKALSRHIGREVIYDNNNLLKCFYVLVPTGRLALVRVEEDCVVFSTYYWFTPHLITLIGKFYEGMIVNV